MIQVIKLPQQPVFDVPRSIAGMEFMLTSIGGKLYLSKKQAMQVLEISYPKTFSYHARAASNPPIGGGMPYPHQDWVVYEIPVLYQTNAAGNGGGMKPTKFYSPQNILEIGARTSNTPNKSALMNWLVNIGNELVQQGFVIDQYALQQDPLVAPTILAKTVAHNYSPARSDLANKSHSINWVFLQCSDSLYSDGTINKAAQSRFRRGVYNTSYIASTGLSALEIKHSRFQPTHIDAGLVHYVANTLPNQNCINTAGNFMQDHELFLNNGLMDIGFSEILAYKFKETYVSYSQALMLFYHKLATLSNFIQTPDMPWYECPETAISKIVNNPNTSLMRADLRNMHIKYWELRSTSWSNLTQEQVVELRALHRDLANEVMYNLELPD